MPLTVEQFTQRLTSSGIMSADEWRDWIAAVPVEKQPSDGDSFADELVRQNKLTKFQAEQIIAGKGESLTLGNYVLLDMLGQGGMGLVYRAWHRRMERVVALKVIAGMVSGDSSALQRFQREVVAAAKLNHPNIVTSYDSDEFKGTCFLVMEYVDGQNLSTLVKTKGALPVESATLCVLQAARGLAYAHAHGVIHRDIKPSNLLHDHEGTVKVLDMGLARIDATGLNRVVGDRELTTSGTVMGSIDYMSPEQAVDSRQADAKSDQYSLGCTLYFLLNGRSLYQGETEMLRLLAHREQPTPQLEAEQSEVPQSLARVFARMVAKRPEQRFPNMTEVIAALEACLAEPAMSSIERTIPPEQEGSRARLKMFVGARSEAAAPLATMDGLTEPDLAFTRTVLGITDTDPASNVLSPSRARQRHGWSALRSDRRVWFAVTALIVVTAWFLFPPRRLENSQSGTTEPKPPGAVTSPSEGELVPAGSTVDLIPLVNPDSLANGSARDLSIQSDVLTLDSSSRSRQMWLNFPNVNVEHATIRTRCRLTKIQTQSFVKLVIGFEPELYGLVGQDEEGAFYEIMTSDPDRPTIRKNVSRTLDSEFIEIAFTISEDRVQLFVAGEQVLEGPRPPRAVGLVALVAYGCQVEFEQPRVVVPASK